MSPFASIILIKFNRIISERIQRTQSPVRESEAAGNEHRFMLSILNTEYTLTWDNAHVDIMAWCMMGITFGNVC
jgi:hypothetical protein